MFRKISAREQGLMTLLKQGRLCWCDPLAPPPPAYTSSSFYRYVGLHPDRIDIDEQLLLRWAENAELYEYMKEKLNEPPTDKWG